MALSVDGDRLPPSPASRMDRGRGYFGVRELRFEDLPNGRVEVGVKWPSSGEYYVDPRLESGLAWWGRLDVRGIPTAVRRKGRYQISLLDAWTLHSWACWLSGPEGAGVEEVTILHVDDHDDLMSPLLVGGGRCWTDVITGGEVELLRPDSVASAVTSGAIDVGSFMVPLIHHVPRVHVRHLCDTRYATERRGRFALRATHEPDDLLAPGAPRPASLLERPATLGHARESSYEAFSDVEPWCEGLPSAPVLLHIDMDFFNNRYNGDSDWEGRPGRYDPQVDRVLTRIDEVIRPLGSLDVAHRPVDVTVALSPGFFPAELWAPAVGRLESLVREVLSSR